MSKYKFIGEFGVNYKGRIGLDELAIKMEDNIEYFYIFKGFLNQILENKQYDYIIMDCPPSNNLITRSAFLLSDYYVIPTILDKVSANGITHYIQILHHVAVTVGTR